MVVKKGHVRSSKVIQEQYKVRKPKVKGGFGFAKPKVRGGVGVAKPKVRGGWGSVWGGSGEVLGRFWQFLVVIWVARGGTRDKIELYDLLISLDSPGFCGATRITKPVKN